MIIITMQESAYSAMMVLNQQGLGSGDHANTQFFTQLQASMDKRRKKAIEEM
jgi:histidinol phosphatase-like enzyme